MSNHVPFCFSAATHRFIAAGTLKALADAQAPGWWVSVASDYDEQASGAYRRETYEEALALADLFLQQGARCFVFHGTYHPIIQPVQSVRLGPAGCETYGLELSDGLWQDRDVVNELLAKARTAQELEAARAAAEESESCTESETLEDCESEVGEPEVPIPNVAPEDVAEIREEDDADFAALDATPPPPTLAETQASALDDFAALDDFDAAK